MGFTKPRRDAAGSQFVDVGIAEEHAVTYAAGLARAGAKPVLGLSKAEAEQRAMGLLDRVGVASQANKVPAQLSGGQQLSLIHI